VLSIGSALGPYRIMAVLGSGGMGIVYRAHDERLGRQVAIKVLPDSVATDHERLYRFEQEARAASALNHPNILTVHDVGTDRGIFFVVTELLEGDTLRGRLSGGPIPVRQAIDCGIQIARGLAAAHDRGIVHRDLKPENVFLTTDGRVKILDFGLAKLMQPDPSPEQQNSVPTAAVTDRHVVLGTVGYMSPEQIRGPGIDPRSDLFSFGTMLYEMLTGNRPFGGATPADTITAILTQEPPNIPEHRHQIPAGLSRIIRHCLEKQPDERFQSARDVAFDLEALTSAPSGDPSAVVLSRSPWVWTVVAAAAVALVTAALLWARRGQPAQQSSPTFHQLTFRDGYVMSARFAGDGHTIVYGAAWDGGPIQLFTARLDHPDSSALPLPAGDILSIASSGDLAVSLGRKYLNGWVSDGTLARAPLIGASPRELLDHVQDADWSPIGDDLAIVRRVDGRHQLEFPVGQVLHTTAGWISQAKVSRNGDPVAFFDHPVYGDDRGSVVVVDRARRLKVLSEGWSSLNGLAWSPAGDEIWFTGARTGTSRDLYAVAFSGKLRMVLRAPGSLALHDVLPDGRALLSRETLRSKIAGVVSGDSSERDLSWHDFSIGVDLSSDSRLLLLSEQGGGAGDLYDVLLRRTDGSPPAILGQGLAMALSPDSKWALSLLLTSPPELVLLPTRSGEPKRLRRGPIDAYGYAASWYPDGKRVLFAGRARGRHDRLYAQRIDDGDPVPVTPEGTSLDLFSDPIAPDGTVAAVAPDGRLWLYRPGREPSLLAAAITGDTPLLWSRDGRSLFVLRRDDASHARVYQIDRVSGYTVAGRTIAPHAAGRWAFCTCSSHRKPTPTSIPTGSVCRTCFSLKA
jgi:hypothetical protein